LSAPFVVWWQSVDGPERRTFDNAGEFHAYLSGRTSHGPRVVFEAYSPQVVAQVID